MSRGHKSLHVGELKIQCPMNRSVATVAELGNVCTLDVHSLPKRLEVWGLQKVKLGKSEQPYKPSAYTPSISLGIYLSCLCLLVLR